MKFCIEREAFTALLMYQTHINPIEQLKLLEINLLSRLAGKLNSLYHFRAYDP